MSTNTDTSETYFHQAEHLVEELTEDIDKKRDKREAIKELDSTLSEIDCDYGLASFSIAGSNRQPTVHVKIVVDQPIELVDQILSEYTWDEKEELSYNKNTGQLKWILEGNLDIL
jgi:sulfite reductase alpha subunit-like flavoprotein